VAYKKFLINFFIIILIIPSVFADFEMTIPMSGNPAIGPMCLINRQDTYYWNNDFFEIVAMGFNTTSLPTQPSGMFSLSTDIDGARMYRWQVTVQSTNLKPPVGIGEDTICTNGSRWGAGNVQLSLAGGIPYPRYPHAVLRLKPCYALKYPDTTSYAPPLSYTDIDPGTGAVIGQTDYYDPAAWVPRNDAPLFVKSTQHPTQLWIGIHHMPAGTTVQDADNPANYYPGAYAVWVSAGAGYRWAPNSPTGAGVNYTHTSGSGPGGLMWSMASAWGQEFFGYDMRIPLSIGTKECGIGLFNDGSGGADWSWAGNVCSNGSGDGPYQMIDFDIQMSMSSLPDYFAHNNSYQNGPTILPETRNNIVNATVTMLLDLSSRYYGYFSAQRSFRLDEFAELAQDPYAMTRIVVVGYNKGPHSEVQNLRCGQAARTSALSSPNISRDSGIVGNGWYAPQIVDLMKRIGTSNNVYDWAITWGDVQDFLNDLRMVHYANGVPTNAQWTAMVNELQLAFQRMQGKVPAGQQPTGYNANTISFRYNWLTLLRIMKKYLPEPRLYLPKNHIYNQSDFLDAYSNFMGLEEVQNLCSANNLAPEIYWITPRHPFPSSEQAFPVIPDVCNNTPFAITSDVLDDNVGGGGMTVRYAISHGDPSVSGQWSYWLDNRMTGGTIANPLPTDWNNMADIGASSAPAGGRRYSAVFDPTGITGTRRVYIEANDNCGYKTISWVDVSFVDCSVFTPTPTPCTPNLGLPKGNDPINCFPDASSINGITATYGTVSWESSIANSYDTVGALKHTRNSGGQLWFGRILNIPVSQGNLNGYNRLCVYIRNMTASSFVIRLMSSFNQISVSDQTISSTADWTQYCWDLQNQSVASSVEFEVESGPLNQGDLYFDVFTLRTTGGITESDPRCCPPAMSNTPTPTFTNTFTNTPTFTATNTPTNTVTFTFTNTFTNTATNTRTNTFTDTLTFTNTHTPTYTQTNTYTPTSTITNTPTNTFTVTFTETQTNTRTNTSTNTLTWTETVTGTPPPTWTFTDTPTDTNTFTPTFTRTFTGTFTMSATFTETFTVTFTPTVTSTGTPPPTSTFTNTATHTSTPTSSFTNTPTFTFSLTSTYTSTRTATSTFTDTLTSTHTSTYTNTFTPSYTPTITPTPRPSPVMLEVKLTASGDEPAIGAKITYIVKITNNENRPVYNLSIWDSLPSNLKFIASPGNTVNTNGNYINWDLFGSVLNPGDSLIIKFTVEVISINKNMPIANSVYVDYNDDYYVNPLRHPPIESNIAYFPSDLPVIYPNPFNPMKAIGGVLKIDNLIPGSTVQIYTLSGEIVMSLTASSVKVIWDGKNRQGKKVSPGIYYYVIKSSESKIYLGKLFIIN